MNPATDQYNAEPGDDPRLVRATQEYLAELESGLRPNRAAFVARFSDLASALTPYLDALDMVHGAAPVLRSSTGRRVADVSLPAEPLGDFRIVGEIGRGGMGVVYEAVQMSLGRRVALKVLPFAAALDAKQLQRFQNEAQAAAQLHHTNIVPVYAVGVERGVHYYAMQLIEGQNLAELIDQMRPRGPATTRSGPAPGDAPDLGRTGPLTTAPGRPAAAATVNGAAAELSTLRTAHSANYYRTAARLAAQAAEALDHAHQLGVIHRDIKPANLMVDGRGNLWVTDFGLAQFHTGVGLTRTGDLVGTLRYMSPEQAAGQGAPLDARTDVYSLGATLYELLTLEPLFGGNDHRRLLRQLLYDEPRPPRTVDRLVPPELETIVLKAVSKSPADRYAGAREFADDLNRFLENRPILARRPTVTQRVRKWGRRHPSVVVAAMILLVLTSAGSVVSAALIRDEKANTDAALALEKQRRGQAEERFRIAVQSVDEMFNLSEEELPGRPDLQGLRKRMLETALVHYQALIEQGRDDPGAQAELQANKGRVEKILADLAVMQGGGQLYLLNNPAVLDDLVLTDDQRRKVTEFSHSIDERRKEDFQKYAQLSAEERGQRFLALAREDDKAVRGILTQGQLRRLWQIWLQLKGVHAFNDTQVATELKLDAQQRERIRAIVAGAMFVPPLDSGRPPGRGGPGRGGPGRGALDQWRKDQEKRFQEAKEKIVTAVLKPEQAQHWKEMTGDSFKGRDMEFCPPPGSFGGPDGPGGPPPEPPNGPPPDREGKGPPWGSRHEREP